MTEANPHPDPLRPFGGWPEISIATGPVMFPEATARRVHLAEHPPRVKATPEQLAEWWRWVDEELKWWPEIAHAKQPEPRPFEIGGWSFQPDKLFAQHAENFKLRDPIQGEPKGIPFVKSMGSCLHPLIREGDLAYVDPAATPQHGDMVSVLLHPDKWARLNCDMYGARPKPIVGKILHLVGYTYHCVWNKGSFPLEDNFIVGVKRRVVRDGKRMFE